MAWHVMKGSYYMAYNSTDASANVQPYNLFSRTEGYSALIIFQIEHGLLGTGEGCDPSKPVDASNPETHFDVSGVSFALAANWAPGDLFFATGGKGRLYFDPKVNTSDTQMAVIEDLFHDTGTELHLNAFRSISTRLPSGRLTSRINFTKVGNTTVITAPASDVPAGSGTGTVVVSGGTSLTPLAGAQVGSYKLLNAEPSFRLGGQIVNGLTADIDGVTLASVANSTWADPDLGVMKINGHGETRSFLWADVESAPIPVQALLASLLHPSYLGPEIISLLNDILLTIRGGPDRTDLKRVGTGG